MATNQQRRDAAKRKLERQLVRRQEQLHARRQRTIIGSVLAVVLLTAGIIWFVTADRTDSAADGAGTGEATATESTPETPCTYPSTTDPAVKDVAIPTNINPAQTGQVQVTITLGQGPITATLDRALAPCAVNAFVSLAAQRFYDNTDCHRLTASVNFKILQCGDPSGTGRGGPGFSVSNESSRPDQRTPEEAAAATQSAAPTPAPLHYPVGTLAMASTAPGADSGSQFFIVYDTTIIESPSYTKIGTVDAASIALIQQIAAKGTTTGSNGVNETPAEKVTINSVTVPADAVTSEGPPLSTPSEEPTSTATDSPGTDVPATGSSAITTEATASTVATS